MAILISYVHALLYTWMVTHGGLEMLKVRLLSIAGLPPLSPYFGLTLPVLSLLSNYPSVKLRAGDQHANLLYPWLHLPCWQFPSFHLIGWICTQLVQKNLAPAIIGWACPASKVPGMNGDVTSM